MTELLHAVVTWFSNPVHWQGPGGVPIRLLEHLEMSGTAIAAAMLIALPVGIALGHFGRLGNLAINVSNVGRAIPSFAILVLVMVLRPQGLLAKRGALAAAG